MSLMRIKHKIDTKIVDLKNRIGRFKKGYGLRDNWNLDLWFLELMPRMLDEFADTTMGYPTEYEEIKTFEQWQDTIKYIANCFREANEETCSRQLNYEEDNKDFVKEYDEIFDYRQKRLEEGMAMFTKYFWDLWD